VVAKLGHERAGGSAIFPEASTIARHLLNKVILLENLNVDSQIRWLSKKRDAAFSAQNVCRQPSTARDRRNSSAVDGDLMLRLTFHLPLRQTEGFMDSIFALTGATVSAPGHSTLSRRAATSPAVSLGRMPEGPPHVLIYNLGLKVYDTGEWSRESTARVPAEAERRSRAGRFTERDGRGERTTGVAEGHWLWPPIAGGDHDWSIQTDHWPPISGKIVCRTIDRSRYRYRGSQSHSRGGRPDYARSFGEGRVSRATTPKSRSSRSPCNNAVWIPRTSQPRR
jgi:hypothetical protein